MANQDTPHGFDPYGAIKQVNTFYCDTTTTAIFKGDVVAALATGYVAVSAAGNTQMIGASTGYQAVYATAGTYQIGIYDDPDQMYYAQTVTGTAPTRTIINSFCDHIAGTGSAYTLISGHELNIANTTTSSTYLGWRMLDFVRREDNDTTVEHCDMVTCMNEAARHTIAAGI
jgi:hypothetical protein